MPFILGACPKASACSPLALSESWKDEWIMEEFFTHLLERLGQMPAQPPTVLQLVIVAALVALLVLPRPLWRVTGMYCTLIHELGHVIFALFTGRFVTSLQLGWDHSGQVVSRGRRGWSSAISGVAGYPAPLWCAAGLLAAAAAGYSGWALLAFALLFCGALVFVRNLPAILVCGSSAGAALAILVFAPIPYFTFAVLFMGGFLLLAGLRDMLKLLSVHLWRRHHREQSDAVLIARSTGGYAWIWLWLIMILCACGAWVAVLGVLHLVALAG